MKKILIFIVLSLSLINLKAQISGAGGGGGSIPDSVVYSQELTNAIDTTVGDNTLDAALDTLPTNNEVSTEIGDSLSNYATLDYVNDTVVAADEVFMLADSNSIGGATTWSAYHEIPSDENHVKILNEFGASIKAMPFISGSMGYNSDLTMTDQRAYYVLCRIRDTMTITGMKTTLVTAGNYTADNYNGAALYSISGTDLTRVAMSKNSVAEPNIWETTANTLITIAFDSTGAYEADPGLYMAAFIYSSSAETTAPEIYAYINSALLSYLLLPDNKEASGYVSTQTILPASETFGDIGGNAKIPELILY